MMNISKNFYYVLSYVHYNVRYYSELILKALLKHNNKKTNKVKNRRRICIDSPPKKIYKWPISIRKDAQHH